MAPRKQNKRSKKRTVGLDNELQTTLGGHDARLRAKPNDALFVIDKVGSKAKRRKVQEEEERGALSIVEEKRVKRIIANQKENPAPKKIEKPKYYDPWALDNSKTKYDAKRRSWADKAVTNKKLEVKAAQSYNPTVDDYKTGVNSVIDKQEALEALREIKVTIKLLGNALEDKKEEEDAIEDAESENDMEVKDDSEPKKQKKKEKLTRTQRNKQAKVKELQKEIKDRKSTKELWRDINNAKSIAKKIEKEMRVREEEKRKLEKKKKATKANAIDLEDTRVESILLPHELSDTLRKLKVAGGLLKDQLFILKKQNKFDMGNQAKRRRNARGRKKVVDRSGGFPEYMKKW